MATTITNITGLTVTVDGDTVTLAMPRGMASNLRDLLDMIDLKEYAQNPGYMGVDAEIGQAFADTGYTVLGILTEARV